jgi:hypothetical protein
MRVITAEKYRSRSRSVMNHLGNAANRTAVTLAGEELRTFGEVRLCVFGSSMAPSILPGDFVSIKRAAFHDISPGEVVLFLRKDRLFIHRVVDREFANPADTSPESWLITRGDRLCHVNPPVRSVELLGRVVSIQRGSKHLKPVLPRGRSRQVVARVLRWSDFATHLFIHLAAWWRFVFYERTTPCQA